MVTVGEAAWEPRLRRTLTCEGARPALVLVEGTAGSGRSRLLRALAESAEPPVARVTWTCGGGAPVPEVPAGRSVLLLVDDVHLAGGQEVAWLRGLLEQPRPGLAAVLAYRSEELAVPGLPLGAPPVRYPGELVVLRHRVAPWTREQVLQAATEALGGGTTPEAVDRLHERSGGVAQVVVDVLTALRDSRPQRCTAADVDAVGVPVRLAELALSRTAALGDGSAAVVWAAALLDEPVFGPELTAVAGLTGSAGRAALTAALTGAALTRDEEGRYVPFVPLAAPAVLEVVPWSVRQELHGRAAQVLARRQPVPWAATARHRKAAGDVRGWLRAVERAARQAADAGRHPEAVTLLEGALASDVVPQADRGRLAPVLARNAVVGLRSDQTVKVLSQLMEDTSLPVAVRGELRLDLGLLLCNQVGRSASGWAELERAAEELREERADLAARAMAALAMPQWLGASLDVHETWLRRAARAAADSGSAAARAAVAGNGAAMAMCCGDPEAWQMVRGLPTDSPDRLVAQHAARGVCNAGDAAVWLGHYDRAADLLTEGLDLSARSGSDYVRQTGLGARLLLDWNTGHWTGLVARCEAFVARAGDLPAVNADARLVLGLHAVAQGEWGQAEQWLGGVDASVTDRTAAPTATAASAGLVRLALARQDLAAAARQAREAWAGIENKNVWVWAAELAPWAVEALARTGDAATARSMTDRFAAGLVGRDSPSASACLEWARAALAEAEGALTEAVPRYRRAAEAFGHMRRPYSRTITAEAAARCALAAGDEDAKAQALSDLATCEREFADRGATWDAARVRAELRAHQPYEKRRPRGRPSYADELSPREREVGELAAGGLTNREIAATLHLSHRTVEQHVARAMRKLGTTSRTRLVEPQHRPAHLGGGEEE
ncbi:helix-turn-helix transcriptional regulator [Streptomyces sp. B1I3]|uniref:helix-turn-helix domain-containing protein n=1 Tax=Streptomyces sp. B1I3 TaxID=3042264 RepID=UPI002789EC0F|nr:helix-turn-helix transcriptional regulator [Streptomyces sp. B1I3]MDQ0792610.1 DNA-binding CsgD family transcriptional regulator [Streptomyces sp. B1I3]